jgi:hypothetical protein
MPANAFLTSAAIGNREDLTDVIWNTAPSETPLMSSIDKVQASGVTHEWQRDVLRAPGTASLVAEGADATYTAVTPTQRLSNPCQINRVTFSISDTQEAVKKAGRSSEVRYQTVKQGKELRKDMELAAIENPVFVASGTRQTRGLRGWTTTNPGLGAGGVAPNISTNVAPTDGTLRALTEALLRAAVLGSFNNGGNATMLMVTPSHKQTISSTFTGNGTKFIKGEDRKLQAAYDIYNSDFGDFKIVPNRNMVRTREAYLVDGDLAAVAMLRDMKSEELARIGSARNFMIESEWALQLREERGMAAIRDLNP